MTAELYLLVAVAVLAVLFQMRLISEGLDEARTDISLYRLYEARDELTLLVATEKMGEDDPAWQHAYVSVSGMLRARNLDLWSYVRELVRFFELMESAGMTRNELRKRNSSIAHAARTIPEFAAAQRSVQMGFMWAMTAQTTAFQMWTFDVLGWLVPRFSRQNRQKKATSLGLVSAYVEQAEA